MRRRREETLTRRGELSSTVGDLSLINNLTDYKMSQTLVGGVRGVRGGPRVNLCT